MGLIVRVKIFPSITVKQVFRPVFGRPKRFAMETLQSKLPQSSSYTAESCIVRRQIEVKVSRFVVVSGPLPTGRVTQRMRNGRFRIY